MCNSDEARRKRGHATRNAVTAVTGGKIKK